MKILLIAASIATAIAGAAVPALAQDMRPGMNQPNSNDDGRRDRGAENKMSRDDQRMSRGDDRNDRASGWNGRRCHNVRRHHRWVRVCNGRR